jgi:hypothetical protein
MHTLMTAIGWRDLNGSSMLMIAFAGGGTLLIFSYMMDVLLERFSFGILMNFSLMLAGIVLGLVMLQWFGWPPNRREFLHALLFCTFTGVLMLVAACSMKRAV